MCKNYVRGGKYKISWTKHSNFWNTIWLRQVPYIRVFTILRLKIKSLYAYASAFNFIPNTDEWCQLFAFHLCVIKWYSYDSNFTLNAYYPKVSPNVLSTFLRACGWLIPSFKLPGFQTKICRAKHRITQKKAAREFHSSEKGIL